MLKPSVRINDRGEGFKQGTFIPKNPEKYKGIWPIVFRSSWEYKFMRFLDINEGIISWTSESIKIRYMYFDPITKKQSEHLYFPDFVICRKIGETTRTQIIEIKPYRETKPPKVAKNRSTKTLIYETKTYAKNQAKWHAAKEYCRVRDWDFIVLTEKDLP
jgi:predicted nuclease of restriction endonuclease-like RecB superfamily